MVDASAICPAKSPAPSALMPTLAPSATSIACTFVLAVSALDEGELLLGEEADERLEGERAARLARQPLLEPAYLVLEQRDVVRDAHGAVLGVGVDLHARVRARKRWSVLVHVLVQVCF